MPLLGRHKSATGSAAAANQSSGATSRQAAAAAAAPVCESPLFGVRRQLPVASSRPYADEQAAGGRQRSPPQSAAPSSSRRLSSASSSSSASAPSASNRVRRQSSRDGQLGSTLSSIPSQISRQQIHYAFSMMDTNSDGLIDLRDLSQTLANLGVPIDEAILSHVMAPVSKRGDQLISESEFLDWIGNFIQILDESASSGERRAPSRASPRNRSPASRSASASSSLAAQSEEAQIAIEQQLRKRRGSGSGLALVRSPASGAASPPTETKRERQLQDQLEARRDLKAAFCVFDLDGDGFITLDEVHQGLKLLGESWSQAELEQLFSRCGGAAAADQSAQPSRARADLTGEQAARQRISIDDFVHLLL